MHQVSRPLNTDVAWGIPTKDAHLKPGRMTALQNPTSPGAPGGNRAWTFPGPAQLSEFRLTLGTVKSDHGSLHTQLGLVLSVYTSPHLTLVTPKATLTPPLLGPEKPHKSRENLSTWYAFSVKQVWTGGRRRGWSTGGDGSSSSGSTRRSSSTSCIKRHE